jgi:anion transporter
MSSAVIACIILVLLVILFVTELIPLTATALLGCVLFAVTGAADYGRAFSGFSHNHVIMLIGVMIVGEAMMGSGLAMLIGNICVKLSRNNEKRFILCSCLGVALLSMWLDNTTMLAVFISIMTGVAAVGNMKMLNMTMPVALCSMVGGSLTLIGCPVNLTGQSILKGMTGHEFRFFDFAKAGLPIYLITLVYITTLGAKRAKKIWGDRPDGEVDMSRISKPAGENKRKIILMCGILLLMVIGFMTEVFPVGLTANIAGLLCIVLRLVDYKSVIRKINWDVILRLAAMLGIAGSLSDSGLSDMLANAFIINFGKDFSPYLLMTLVTLAAMGTSQFLGNSTVVFVLLPPVLSVTGGLGYSPLPFALAVMYGASFAFMTPIAGVCIGLSMVAGYKFNDYFRYTWPLSLASAIGIIILAPLAFPF